MNSKILFTSYLLVSQLIAAMAFDLSVHPEKLWIKPGETQKIIVKVNGLGKGETAKLQCRVVCGLNQECAYYEGRTDKDGEAVFEFKADREFGHEAWAMASAGGRWADNRGYFTCSESPFATAVDYGGATVNAFLDLLPDKTPAPGGEPQNPALVKKIADEIARCREYYYSLVESGGTFCTFYPGVPPTDNFFTMGHYFGSMNGWRKLYSSLKQNGIACMVYWGAFLTSTGGSDFARRHPDLLSYGQDGWFMSEIDTVNTEEFESYYRNYPESLKTIKLEWWKGLMGKPADLLCGRPCFIEPRASEIGTQCVLDSYQAFGFGGVRSDGHFQVPCYGDPLAVATELMDWKGDPQPTGPEADALTTRNMKYFMETVRSKHPEFLFGFNYAALRPDSWGKDDKNLAQSEEIKTIVPGSWILDECAKGALSPSHPDNKWTDFIRTHGKQSDRARSLGAYLFAGWGGGPGKNDFDTRLVKAISWSLGFRWIRGTDKNFADSYRRDNQFCFRFSEFILGNKRTRIALAEAEKMIAVRAQPHRPIWFKDFAYRLESEKGARYLVLNLINSPIEENLTVDAVPPPPARDLHLEFKTKIFEGASPVTEDICVLSPDSSPFLRNVPSVRMEGEWLKMELPSFPLWCVLIVPLKK